MKELQKMFAAVLVLVGGAMGNDEMKITFDENGLPLITQISEDGFVNLLFKVTKDEKLKDGFRKITCGGNYNQQVVGFSVVVKPNMKQGLNLKTGTLVKKEVHRKGVELISLGTESDNLLSAISREYGMGSSRRMVDSFSFTTIALQGNPCKMDKESVRMELFGNDQEGIEDKYFESLLNLYLKDGIVT